MKKFLFTSCLLVSSLLFSQANSTYQSRVDLVKQDSIQKYNTELVSYGIRSVGNASYQTNNTNAQNYIIKKYKHFGYTYTGTPATDDITLQSFTYSTRTYNNIIVTKKGTVYPNEYVIICGHFDSVNAGVGANDNGSGTALILEIARILKNVPTEYSIKFINFNSEEYGLTGSTKYVSQVVNGTTPKMKIRLVFNLDMIGGVNGQTNNSIFCEADRQPNADWSFNASGTTQGTKTTNDLASYNFVKSLKDYVTYYSTLTPVPSYAYNSDYMPFENNGEVVCGIYERPVNTSTGAVIDPNPYYHQSTDIQSNFSIPYVYQITRAALGAMQHFAIATSSTTLGTHENSVSKSLLVFPNPAKDIINIDAKTKVSNVKIYDTNGKMLLEKSNTNSVNISKLNKGMYIISVTSEGKEYSEKFIKE